MSPERSLSGSASFGQDESLLVTMPGFSVRFDRCGGGFPTWIGFTGPTEEETVAEVDRAWLSAEVDGLPASPFWPEGYRPAVIGTGEATRVEFRNLPWRRADGTILDGSRLDQRYEFWPDGVCFVRSFFVADAAGTDLAHFRLHPPMSFESGNEVSWAYWERPDSTRADIIQALGGLQRFLPPGAAVAKDGMLLPYVSFDFGRQARRDKHLEWFLEGSNSLGDDHRNIRTAIQWQGNVPELEWDFLRERRSSARGLWQWRNQWGWTLCRAPCHRRH